MAELTFLMHSDPPGDPNQFYTLAKQYFTAAGSTVIDAPPAGQTLEGVFSKLNELKAEQRTINLVSHASGFGAMHGAVTLLDQTAGRQWIIADDLQDALAAGKPPAPGTGIITGKTKVILYGCDVGRSENFLKLLSGLFGNPGEILAPKRVSVFKQDGTQVKYRQAQTWTLVRKSPLIATGSAPAGGWPAYRATFVTDAVTKFARIAIQTDLNGEAQLTSMLQAAAAAATIAYGPSFFLEEQLDILPSGSQTAAAAAASVKPLSNGDPVTVIPQHATDVDDTSLVTTVGPSDAYPANSANTKYAITVHILAQVIDTDVLIAEGPAYRRVTSSKGLAPSPGPKPSGSSGGGAGSGSGASASGDNFQSIVDALLAAGAAQADIDAMLATVPQDDGAADVATGSADDIDAAADPDGQVPPQQEIA